MAVKKSCAAIFILSMFFSLVSVGADVTSQSTVSSERLETSNFLDVKNKIIALGTKLGPSQVLVVYDIDDTLLVANQTLGSDYWLDWQFEEMAKPAPNDAVAADEPGLTKVADILLAITSMHPTEPNVPGVVRELQDQSFTTIILTARADRYRSSTELQLKNAGFDLTRCPLGEGRGYAGTYLPWDPAKPEESGLTGELVGGLRTRVALPVSYMNGIMMGDFQNKGLVLRTLLHKVGRKFKAVVFVDDKTSNVEAMHAAFASFDTALISIRYGHEDAAVKAFKQSDKKEVKAQWRQLASVLARIFKK